MSRIQFHLCGASGFFDHGDWIDDSDIPLSPFMIDDGAKVSKLIDHRGGSNNFLSAHLDTLQL